MGEACLPSNAYYPRTPDYTLYSGVHVCWSEHSDSSFVYGFMSLDIGWGTMTSTTFQTGYFLYSRFLFRRAISFVVESFSDGLCPSEKDSTIRKRLLRVANVSFIEKIAFWKWAKTSFDSVTSHESVYVPLKCILPDRRQWALHLLPLFVISFWRGEQKSANTRNDILLTFFSPIYYKEHLSKDTMR